MTYEAGNAELMRASAHKAAEIKMRTHALLADGTYRSWIYTRDYNTSQEAQEFIERGLDAGMSCEQIFELSVSTHGITA